VLRKSLVSNEAGTRKKREKRGEIANEMLKRFYSRSLRGSYVNSISLQLDA